MIKKELTVDEYFDDPVNTTMINERCIELALGLRYIEKVGSAKLTEVGCVMPFYGYCEPPIIDLFEKDHPSGEVQNVDAEECDFTGRDVLCLSTLEHVGKDDYDNPDIDAQKAIRILDKITNESNTFMVTWGTRYHNELDTYVKDNLDKYDWFGYIKKEEKVWEYTGTDMKVWDQDFDKPYRYANGNIFLLSKQQAVTSIKTTAYTIKISLDKTSNISYIIYNDQKGILRVLYLSSIKTTPYDYSP